MIFFERDFEFIAVIPTDLSKFSKSCALNFARVFVYTIFCYFFANKTPKTRKILLANARLARSLSYLYVFTLLVVRTHRNRQRRRFLLAGKRDAARTTEEGRKVGVAPGERRNSPKPLPGHREITDSPVRLVRILSPIYVNASRMENPTVQNCRRDPGRRDASDTTRR